MSLHFIRRGKRGAEPLLLLHGLFGSLENLGGISRLLADSYDLYALDLPEHGKSPHSSQTSLSRMADDVLAWCKHQKLTSLNVLGHSLGGKVAMELALREPEKISRLIVMDISPRAYDPHHHSVFEGLNAVQPEVLTSRQAADEAMQPYVPEYPIRAFLLKNLQKEENAFRWRMNLSVLEDNYPLLVAENSSMTFSGPTLFLKGGASDYITERDRDEIQSRFPKAELKVLAHCGHWLHAEKPELVVRLCRKFLETSDE